MMCANCPKETTDPANCYEDEGFLRIDGIGEWVCSEECELEAQIQDYQNLHQMYRDMAKVATQYGVSKLADEMTGKMADLESSIFELQEALAA